MTSTELAKTYISDELVSTITQAIVNCAAILFEKHSPEQIFGFALGTDDDVCSVYAVACTRRWVQALDAEDTEFAFNFVEWETEIDNEALYSISQIFTSGASADYGDPLSTPFVNSLRWATARDARFKAMVNALLACRAGSVFNEDTFLCVGSTDPSEHMQQLERTAVERLNPPEIAHSTYRALHDT